jgi:transcriptional regulator with XRE-family HTH domain
MPDNTPSTDDAFVARLMGRTIRPERPALWLSDPTVAALQPLCPPADIDGALEARLEARLQQAATDLEFARGRHRRGGATFGAYLAFLRERAGLALPQAARRFGLDPALLSEVERDAARLERLPIARLASALRRLEGSLEQAERLLLVTFQPLHLRPGRLYRRGEDAALHAGDPETLRHAAEELRDAWRNG